MTTHLLTGLCTALLVVLSSNAWADGSAAETPFPSPSDAPGALAQSVQSQSARAIVGTIGFKHSAQVRNVSIESKNLCDPSTDYFIETIAPSFGPFDELLTKFGVGAEQTSTLCQRAIHLSGNSNAAGGGCAGSASQEGVSSAFVAFSIDEPMAAELHLAVNFQPAFGVEPLYAVHGPGLNFEADFLDMMQGAPTSVDWVGTLHPGSYTIEIRTSIWGAGSGSGGSASYSLSLVATAPLRDADLDGNGVVDVDDLDAMIDRWGEPGVGDLDCDGSVGGDDLGMLLADWGA
jgi:hypothetical protein